VCHKLHYEDESGRVIAFHPSEFERGVKKRHSGDPRPRSIRYLKSMLAGQCRRRGLPRYVRGLCLICNKLVFSSAGNPPRVHAPCLYDYQRLNGVHTALPAAPLNKRPGVRPTLENLQRHWAWAIRHRLGGDSLNDIGKEFCIAKRSVADAIDMIMEHLPAPEQVARQYRQRIALIQSARV
jgi:hypothetical protein